MVPKLFGAYSNRWLVVGCISRGWEAELILNITNSSPTKVWVGVDFSNVVVKKYLNH